MVGRRQGEGRWDSRSWAQIKSLLPGVSTGYFLSACMLHGEWNNAGYSQQNKFTLVVGNQSKSDAINVVFVISKQNDIFVKTMQFSATHTYIYLYFAYSSASTFCIYLNTHIEAVFRIL